MTATSPIRPRRVSMRSWFLIGCNPADTCQMPSRLVRMRRFDSAPPCCEPYVGSRIRRTALSDPRWSCPSPTQGDQRPIAQRFKPQRESKSHRRFPIEFTERVADSRLKRITVRVHRHTRHTLADNDKS